MPAAITTRITAGTGATVNNAPLTNLQLDNNFINLNTAKLDATGASPTFVNLFATGNVGIGTSTPATKVDVNGTQIIRGDSSGYSLFIPKFGTDPFNANYDRFEIRLDTANPLAYIGNVHGGTGVARALSFLAGGSERMRLFTSGGVSIGNTTDPGAAGLSVTGATTLSSTLAVSGNTTITLDLAVNGGDITTTASTFNIANSASALTVNIGTAATALSIGAATGVLKVNNTTLEAKAITASTTLGVTGNATIGGTLTVTGTITGSITGNAGTVTNGVYTTGNQTIAGTKTFSSSISGNLSGNVTGNLTGNVTGNLTGNTTVGGTLGVTGATTLSNTLNLVAGTTTIAPLRLATGTNMTTPPAGAVEFDGVNQYFTPNAVHGRNVIPLLQQFVLSANSTALANIGATTNTYFGANSAASLDAATTYEIECYCILLKTTAGTLTWVPTFSTAVTSAHAYLEYTPIAGFTTTTITGAMVVGQATNTAVTALTFAATGSLTTAVNHVHKIKMIVRTNTACNFRLNVLQSAGTTTPLAGSFMTIQRITSTAGNFVA